MRTDHVSIRWAVLAAVLIFPFAYMNAQSEKFSVSLNPGILRGPRELFDAGRGPRPLAAVEDWRGQVSRFISNEVIYGDDPAKLPAFLAKYNGQVIATVKRPPGLALAAFQEASVIRLDASHFDPRNFPSDAMRLGAIGHQKFSSPLAVRLAALVASEQASGLKVALNFVSEFHDFPTSSTEQADQSGVADAFKWPEFDKQAWQFLSANGYSRRVSVAIIDGGFWLNSNGVACDYVADSLCGPSAVAKGFSDLPLQIPQFNTIGNGGSTAGGMNPNSCTGGSPCPWHGNKTASVVAAVLNNSVGAAGTGGQIADPILLKTDGSDDSVGAGVLDAMGFGADIINLSLGGACNWWCQAGHSLGVMDTIMDSVLDSGILIVASAGNDSGDVNQRGEWPCTYTDHNGNGVFCIGALNSFPDGNGYYTKTDYASASYSNFGDRVNIWAPTNIHAMPDGGSKGALTFHNGTSASAPYVSGVAAMIKAINPSLSGQDIQGLITGSGFLGACWYWNGYGVVQRPFCSTPNATARLVLWPYHALEAAAGGYHLVPEIHITSPHDGDTIQTGKCYCVNFTATAADVEDGVWPLQKYANQGPTDIIWTSDLDGAIGNGTNLTVDFSHATEGLRHITATITNSHGISNSVTIAVTVTLPHVTPAPVITWQPPSNPLPAGTYIVTGYAPSTDPQALGNFDCSRLVWNHTVTATPVPNTNGICQAPLLFSGPVQTLTLSATDRFGDTGSTSITFNVSGSAANMLTVQILNPLPGSSVRTGGSVGLLGNAAPLLDNSIATYLWYWYYTASGPASRTLIGQGQNATWNVQASGLCQTENAQAVTLELDVNDSTPPGPHLPHQPPKNPGKTITGSTTANIQVTCQQAH